MKRCAKSQPEPDCLAHFRTTNGAGTWEQWRAQEPDCYTHIRDLTRQDQGGLCAYCELNLGQDDEQVTHFHPKSAMTTSHNWALDWPNLWLACKGGSQTWMQERDRYCPPLPDNLRCNEGKGNGIVDGVVLTPGEIPAFPRIFRFEQYPDRLSSWHSGAQHQKIRATFGRHALSMAWDYAEGNAFSDSTGNFYRQVWLASKVFELLLIFRANENRFSRIT